MSGIELAEQIRGYLAAQVLDVAGRGCRVERCSVDEFQGPSPCSYDHVIASQLLPPPDNGPKTNVSERAPDISEHLDNGHKL